MNWQTDAIRDYVFPIFTLRKGRSGYRFDRMLGTAFSIGSRGFALTAAHVIRGETGFMAGVFVKDDRYAPFPIEGQELHPEEDIALIKLAGESWRSIFSLSSEHLNSSLRYQSFGYPADALHDDRDRRLADGSVVPHPDLVYTEGYVRRRISWNPGIPHVRGKSFIELSTVAGLGCSGSPILRMVPRKNWPVVALYVGERLNDVATSVAYAVRVDAFCEWTPSILSRRIMDEANSER